MSRKISIATIQSLVKENLGTYELEVLDELDNEINNTGLPNVSMPMEKSSIGSIYIKLQNKISSILYSCDVELKQVKRDKEVLQSELFSQYKGSSIKVVEVNHIIACDSRVIDLQRSIDDLEIIRNFIFSKVMLLSNILQLCK